jgi:hypothetical protein
MIQRIKSKKMLAFIPLVLLMVAATSGQIGIAKAYWGGWNGGGYGNGWGGGWGHWHHWGWGGYHGGWYNWGGQGCCNNNYVPQNNCQSWDNSCNNYQPGYNGENGQQQENNQQSNLQSNQQQSSNSISSSTSSPNVKVIVNNYPSNSNNSTAGATAPTDSGSGNQG